MKRKSEPKLLAGILSLCIIAFVIIDEPTNQLQKFGGRRSLAQLLRGERNAGEENGIYTWAKDHLKSVTEFPKPKEEEGIFFYIPGSGGSATNIFDCFSKHAIVISQPEEVATVSYKRRLVQSGEIDIIATAYPRYAVENLLGHYKGRMVALFHHPVDRLIRKFHADWERTNSPEWEKKYIFDWAMYINKDNNAYVKKLAGRLQHDTATERDLQIAKRTIKYYFIVGVVNQMEESVKRFNVVLGINGTEGSNARCMENHYTWDGTVEGEARNSYPHPKLEEDDPGYKLLAEQNSLDIKLFQYIEELFKSQEALIEQYKLYPEFDTNTLLVSEVEDGSSIGNEILELQGGSSNAETREVQGGGSLQLGEV